MVFSVGVSSRRESQVVRYSSCEGRLYTYVCMYLCLFVCLFVCMYIYTSGGESILIMHTLASAG